MKRSLRCVIIGGVAAGTRAASKARRLDPSMDITVITDEQYVSYAGCGLAYYIGGVVKSRNDLFARSPEYFRQKQNIDLRLRTRAERINTWDREVKIHDLERSSPQTLPYDRLVIATGTSAVKPPISGIDGHGVFTLHNIPDADAIRSWLDSESPRRACVMGGGFIGIEMAENLRHRGLDVTVFEMADRLMPGLYGAESSQLIRDAMEKHGIDIHTGTKVESINTGAGGVVASVTAGNMDYPCDIAIVAAGVIPNNALAREANIAVGPTGGIRTNERLETSSRGIYAAGDCAETKHLVSGKPYRLSLGSTANKMGRVAGMNVTGGSAAFAGVLGTSILKAFDSTAARTGLTEEEARDTGFNPETVTVTTPTRAGYYPGGGTLTLTVVADRATRRILGAEAVGTDSVDKIIDTTAGALTGSLTVDDLLSIDLSYSPPYSTATGTLIVAAQVLDDRLG